MNFFIDFEAAQFSNEIIEIGCIAEDGRTFSSYVNAKKKITPFITELTGITQETVDAAPHPDNVFQDMWNWICLHYSPNDIENFYCYGNSDIDFVLATLRKCKNFYSRSMLSFLSTNLVNYDKFVDRHFGLTSPIRLIKVVEYYRGEEVVQKHNALEDAMMLREIYQHIQNEPQNFECEFFAKWRPHGDDSLSTKPPKKKEVDEDLVRLMFETNSKGKISNGIPALEFKGQVGFRKGPNFKIFDNMNEAVDWVFKSKKLQPDADPNRVARHIRKAINQKEAYHGLKWYVAKSQEEKEDV